MDSDKPLLLRCSLSIAFKTLTLYWIVLVTRKKNYEFQMYNFSRTFFGKNIIFWEKKILKKEFCISDIDINKVLLSKEEQFGINGSVKYFIGYGDTDVLDFYA